MQTSDNISKPKRVAKQAPSTARFGMSNNFIFIACILIATFAWLLIKLSDTYTVTNNFKLSYIDLPVDKKLTYVADSNVNISFTDDGFALLKLELFSNMKQLNILVSKYDLLNEKDNYFQLSTKEVKKYLSEETGIGMDNILFSKPYLGFEMEDLHSKKTSVTESLLVKFKEQYDFYGGVLVSPQKITVFGPKNVLDTLQNLVTEKIELNGVESEQSIVVKIFNPQPKLLRFEPNQVTVSFQVEKFTESSIDVPIDISETKEEISIFPKTVKISFKIAQKDFNTIEQSLFAVSTETNNVDINSVNKLKLKLTKKPPFIHDEWLMPAEVEFLIIK